MFRCHEIVLKFPAKHVDLTNTVLQALPAAVGTGGALPPEVGTGENFLITFLFTSAESGCYLRSPNVIERVSVSYPNGELAQSRSASEQFSATGGQV